MIRVSFSFHAVAKQGIQTDTSLAISRVPSEIIPGWAVSRRRNKCAL